MSVNAKSAEDFVSDCQPDVCTTSLVRSKLNSIKSGIWSKYRKALVILLTAHRTIETEDVLGFISM